MRREDFKKIKKEHFETCEHMVENEGRCFSVSCGNCPFSYLNSINELGCMDNGYSNGGSAKKPDNKLVASSKEFLKFRKENKMEKEKVLEVEFQDVFDKVAWRVIYQNEAILKRGVFEDEELRVEAWGYPRFEEGILYLRGNDTRGDYYANMCTKEEAEIIKKRVNNINEKYGIHKRWRAEKGEKYFFVSSDGGIFEDTDDRYDVDNSRYELGNYFKTWKEAQIKLDKIKLIFKED